MPWLYKDCVRFKQNIFQINVKNDFWYFLVLYHPYDTYVNRLEYDNMYIVIEYEDIYLKHEIYQKNKKSYL